MLCRITDPIYGTNLQCAFEGKLNDDSHKLTRKVIEMMDLQTDLSQERLEVDETIDGTRTLIWTSKENHDPITFIFSEGGAE